MNNRVEKIVSGDIVAENNLSNFDTEVLTSSLRKMLLIRKVERKLAWAKEKGYIVGPVHLGVGQEAIAAGISHSLKKTDRVFGAHRSHSHILSLNPSPYKLFAEVLAKSSGFSKGMGGSMHLFDVENGFYGSVPIVAGTVPLAVGAALAAKFQGKDGIGVSYLGDGAVEEGVVHESLNFAKLYGIPVLFVVENNLFASHMHISQRQPNSQTSRFAQANEIDYDIINGNDVLEVLEYSKKHIAKIRKSSAPALLELITYRWYGHVDWREDIDVGVNRSQEDVKMWKARDPIARLANLMIENNLWNSKLHSSLEQELDNLIESDWQKANKDKHPDSSMLMKHVFSS